MKKFSTVFLILLIARAFFTCDDKPKDDPKTQTTIITTSFGDITVTGFFTNAEWSGVPDKIKTALNSAYTPVGVNTQNAVKAKSVTIIVEKNPTYTKYSTTLNGNTIHINFAIVNDADVLTNSIGLSCWVLSGDTGVATAG
jgi:hypothetical protein